MDVSAAASSSSAASAASLQQDAGVAVLKKSVDAEQALALQLIDTIQAPQPQHLGSRIDILA